MWFTLSYKKGQRYGFKVAFYLAIDLLVITIYSANYSHVFLVL